LSGIIWEDANYSASASKRITIHNKRVMMGHYLNHAQDAY
jgi:hypothetical protein